MLNMHCDLIWEALKDTLQEIGRQCYSDLHDAHSKLVRNAGEPDMRHGDEVDDDSVLLDLWQTENDTDSTPRPYIQMHQNSDREALHQDDLPSRRVTNLETLTEILRSMADESTDILPTVPEHFEKDDDASAQSEFEGRRPLEKTLNTLPELYSLILIQFDRVKIAENAFDIAGYDLSLTEHPRSSRVLRYKLTSTHEDLIANTWLLAGLLCTLKARSTSCLANLDKKMKRYQARRELLLKNRYAEYFQPRDEVQEFCEFIKARRETASISKQRLDSMVQQWHHLTEDLPRFSVSRPMKGRHIYEAHTSNSIFPSESKHRTSQVAELDNGWTSSEDEDPGSDSEDLGRVFVRNQGLRKLSLVNKFLKIKALDERHLKKLSVSEQGEGCSGLKAEELAPKETPSERPSKAVGDSDAKMGDGR